MGRCNAKTYDGKPLHFSFYVTSSYILKEETEQPVQNKIAWHNAYVKGNEIGNHTHTHPHGLKMTSAEWEKEIQTCINLITKSFDPHEITSGYKSSKGVGVSESDIFGFRAPFLEYNDNMFQVLKGKNFLYDCSIEEGFQDEQDGTNFYWPYTLDNGSPGSVFMAQYTDKKQVGNYAGLWEVPVYAVIVPPDNKCSQYGVAPGLRAKLHNKNSYFEITEGKITGLDWNLWFDFGMTKEEFAATLKYTLDLRLKGNRCPFTFGMHSDMYVDDYIEEAPHANPEQRRQAVEEFIDYALTKPDVRVVSVKEMMDWLRDPVALK